MTMRERPRRLRRSSAMRGLVRETGLRAENLLLPMFVRDVERPVPISTMPGVVQHSFESLRAAAHEALEAGVGGVLLFGVPDARDAMGSEALHADGILTRAVREVRDVVGQDYPIVADVCLDEFTDHGHCGVLDAGGNVDNDATIDRYARMAVLLAGAGSNVVGLSGMMDGQVGAVRSALDDAGHTETAILAYAVKFASAFYGPFREAVQSRLEGDRRTYQQDPANRREALREARLDVEEGADILLVKPATPYLDVLSDVRDAVDVPVGAYVVSGEYAMVEMAAGAGALDRRRAILELHTSVRRAGATVICTYWATELAGWLTER